MAASTPTRHPVPDILPDQTCLDAKHWQKADTAPIKVSPESADAPLAPPRYASQQEILLLAMKAGQIQLENGAEIFRVEDTIMHICRAYGLHSVNTFVLKRIEEHPGFPPALQIAVAGLSGACFGVMFGGSPRDFLCSIVVGSLYQAYALYLGNPHFSRIVRSILGSAWITFLCILCYRFGPGENFDAMIIGGIILMVPGVAFTNAIRDMADSDYIAGSVRMMDAMLGFFCIAIGVGFVIALYGMVAGSPLLP